jgi:hypothetical protein
MTKIAKLGIVQGLAIIAVVLAGCGGDEGGGGETAPVSTVKKPAPPPPGGQPVAETDTTEPVTGCSVKGDKGNSKGVGVYCEKGANTCATGSFCTGDVGAPEGAHFCAIFCGQDSDCGEDATCFKEARGSACVPKKCLK